MCFRYCSSHCMSLHLIAFGSTAWWLSGEVLFSRWSIFTVENMLTQNMSYVADDSGRSNAIYGRYEPAAQVSMQPPTACHMGEGMPTYTHLMQPATAPCMNQSALLNGRLPPTTLLTSTKPANLQNADKESYADEGWLDDDKSGAEDQGPNEDHTFFGVDLKPVLAIQVWSLHQSQLWLVACACSWCRFHHPIARVALCTFCGGLWHGLGVHGVLCLCWSWASQTDAKDENWCCWWHGHRGGDSVACTQVVAIFPSYPPLWSLLQMGEKCHRSSHRRPMTFFTQSPWICDNGGWFAVNWSAWDHGRHLACHLDRWEELL